MNASTSRDRLWRKRLNELSAVWPEFVHGRTSGLHKTRVASRRIREALPIVGVTAPPSKVKKLNKKMRALTRALGPIRELDVELDMLEERAAAEGSGRALEIVRREIASRRQTLRQTLKDDVPVNDMKRLIKKLERVATVKGRKRKNGTQKSGHKAESKLEAKWRAVLAARLMQRAKRLGAALEEAGPLYVPERLHDVRISTKKLRYALEIARDASVAGTTPLLRVLKRHQERLGHLHDLQMLLKHVRETDAVPGLGARLNDLADYADSLDRECRRVHATFVEGRGDLVSVVTGVRQHIVPALTTPPRRHLAVVARSAKADARVADAGRAPVHARAK
jgi:CHAD domain-containing protein